MNPILRRVLDVMDQMESHQHERVLELARRLVPGLTAEDIRNPHDFPDLEDPDWHFMDGQLAGIKAVRFAIAQAFEKELGDAQAEGAERT